MSTERAVGRPEPIFTRNFLLACFASLGAFFSFYLLLASLPVYVGRVAGGESSLGSETVVGFVIGLFSISAVVVRPFAGQQSDRLGKKSLMLVGAVVLLVSSLLYTVALGVPYLGLLRLFHGLGWGVFSTTTSALVADIVPTARRGEAIGYFGMFGNAAMAVAPALGVVVSSSLGFPALFAVSAIAALVALASTGGLTRTAGVDARSPARARPSLLNRGALFPSAVLACCSLTYASVVSFLPLYAASSNRGLGNPGLFFTVYAVVLIASRGPLGRLSDRVGRTAVIAPGLVLGAAALALLSAAASTLALLLAALLYGVFFGSVQPALMAMAVDRVGPAERGSAMGTFTTAMDLGIGVGSFLWGFVIQASGYSAMYLSAAGVALFALAFVVLGSRRAAARSALPADPGAR